MINKKSKILKIFTNICVLIVMFFILFIILNIIYKGIFELKFNMFSMKYTSENVSMLPAIINTLVIIAIAIVISSIIGICSAIYLEEYTSSTNRYVKYINLSIETLSGIPSIIYGLFGMLFFVSYFKLGISLLSGAFTVSIMVLPTIIRISQEAIKSVPIEYKMGSLALGADRVTTLKKIILPYAKNGILVSIILSVGRIIGESACFIYTAGTVAEIANLFSSGRTLTLHMYILSSEGLEIGASYATGVIILFLVILLNLLTKIIAMKGKK